MVFQSPLPRLRAALDRLRRANGANVTITFALTTLPIMGAVGAAIDYGQANSVKTAMQAAADATALMLARDAHWLNEKQFQTRADQYFKAQLQRDIEGLEVSAVYSTDAGSRVVVNAGAAVPTDFVRMIGYSTLNVGVHSQVRWGNERLRVSLVLDVTGSMARHGKMPALKEAARGFLKELESAASRDGDVYVSIIPFNRNVNVGAQHRNEPWLDFDDWEAANGECFGGGGGGSDHPGKGNSQGKGKGKGGDGGGSDLSGHSSKRSCELAGGSWSEPTWNGCVTDRNRDHDTRNTTPTPQISDSLFPAHQYSQCPPELLPLTYNWRALNAMVDSLQPLGRTNQTIGLQWGFQSLTAAPFNIPPKDPDYEYTEVIILMTDGDNTENRWDSTFGGGTGSAAKGRIDARTSLACENVKAAGITLYTIQVNTDGTPTQEFLRDCASSRDKFYLVTSANQIAGTFQAIGSALSNLRLTR